MSWLSKLLGHNEKSEADEETETLQAEEIEKAEEEIVAESTVSKRSKPKKKDSPPSDVAKSTYLPVPDEDVNVVASSFGMLRPKDVAAALYIEQMPAKPFMVHGFVVCVCTDLIPFSLSVIPGLNTEHTMNCPNCNTKISGSKGAKENFVIVTAGVDETIQLYKHSKISIYLDKVTNI